ncbi:hypothetical protein [Vibrio rarus]|uniref:hypothetical protein n=1 Tax=Vibrio rarus TaxID=413403 RepID=UPI0021C28A0E|nr:hypothetical protein [Vibrio rarus]
MKKTILATTILSMISFGTLAKPVNIAEANQQTTLLIKDQMSAIDASILAQLEAQDSSEVVINDEVYQKDSEGGWALVGATSAALFAGLVSGSSSSPSGSNGSDLPGNLPNIDAANPVENTPVTPIEATPEADNGRQISKVGDNIWLITTHDEMDGYIVDERAHKDGIKIYDENGTMVRHLDGSNLPDLPIDGGFDNIDPDYGVQVGTWKRVDTGGAVGIIKFEKVTEDGVQERLIVDERKYNEGIKIYDENGTMVRHLDGSNLPDLPIDGGFDNIDPDYGVQVGTWKRVDTGGAVGIIKFEKVTEDDVQERLIVDERKHNDGVKIYDEDGTLINHITGDISADGGYIETTRGGEIHITVDRESGRIDGVYLNDVAQQRVDNIKDHIGSNPNFKKNLQKLKTRVMSARG